MNDVIKLCTQASLLFLGYVTSMAPRASGALFLEEAFDVDVAVEETGSAFLSVYSHFSFSGPGSLGVVDGVLVTIGNGMQVTVAGSEEFLVIGADFGFDQVGDLAAGIVLGQNSIMVSLFGANQLSLEISGPGGAGPQILPFGYSQGTSLHIEVIQQVPGLFDFTVTSANSPELSFSDSFSNSQSFGGVVGLQRTGNSTGFARFDNFSIQPIPEPSRLFLSLAGCALVLVKRRRERLVI